MKQLFYLSLIALLGNCSQDNSKEEEQLRKEKALIQKERDLSARERELNQKTSSALAQKASDLTPSITKTSSHPSEKKIIMDLLGRKVKGWNFDALAEFKNATIVKQQSSDGYWEGTLDIDLENYKNGDDYFMRLFVTYNHVNDDWILQSYDTVNFYKR